MSSLQSKQEGIFTRRSWSLSSAPVAQMDRARASGARGRGFEPLQARHTYPFYFKQISLFLAESGTDRHCVRRLGIVINVGDHTSFRSRGLTRFVESLPTARSLAGMCPGQAWLNRFRGRKWR